MNREHATSRARRSAETSGWYPDDPTVTLDAVPDILIATDAASVYNALHSVLSTPGTTFRWVRAGQDVRLELDRQDADMAIVDLQIGTMGGIAVALDIRLETDAGRLSGCPVLLTLDRRADVFLARRAGVDGWLLKPLDPIRIRRAAAAILGGGTWYDESFLPDPVVMPVASASVPRPGK
jgi:DNA-binding response OmpR family regulator